MKTIIGVNVIEKGTTNGTITDIGGNYSIDVPSGAVLVFSYIGYVSKDVLVGNNSVVNATLSEDMQSLDEVVVVSYGTQKKRDLTGSVSKVNADELSSIPVGQLGQKITRAGCRCADQSSFRNAGSRYGIPYSWGCLYKWR